MTFQKVLFIDFRDSFTFSLVELVKKFFNDIYLIDHLDINRVDNHAYDLVVLGPGPGHINDYPIAKEFIKNNFGKTKLLGVCLGHQLLCDFAGLECVKLDFPLHGSSIKIPNVSNCLDIEEINAQFYNSWVMTGNGKREFEYHVVNDRGFVAAFFAEDIAGIQFHPESVGTNCPELIFEKLIHSMYNGRHDLKNGRSLRLTNY